MIIWHNFFMAIAGASAALAGLIFVGLSLSIQKIILDSTLSSRALEGILILLNILIISSLALVPNQSMKMMGLEIVGVSAICCISVSYLSIKHIRFFVKKTKRYLLARIGLLQLATLPFLVGGVIILMCGELGLYWLVPGVIFSFFVSIVNAWVLLVEINR